MKLCRTRKSVALILMTVLAVSTLFYLPQAADAGEKIKIYINGRIIATDTDPVIINDRTMVPIRVISESLGMDVNWDGTSRSVYITTPAAPAEKTVTVPDNDQWQSISIMGESMVSSAELKRLALKNNPNAPDLADLYIKIGKEYGIRGDIAFCQAAKETVGGNTAGWFSRNKIITADSVLPEKPQRLMRIYAEPTRIGYGLKKAGMGHSLIHRLLV